MPAYELLMETNARLLEGPPLSDAEKRDITVRLLACAGKPGKAGGNPMYPWFFLPVGGKTKRRLISSELPGTQLLSANHYELEILRLLALDSASPEAVHG